MAGPLPSSVLARITAAFFVVSGLIACVRGLLAGAPIEPDQLVSQLTAIAFGLFAWFAPWDRWPQRALFTIVIAALVLKATGNATRGPSPYIYAAHYVVLYMWIGVALPRWSGVLTSPLLLASYLGPMLYMGLPAKDLASAVVVVPICLMVGEAAGWIASRLVDAERRSQSRSQELANLVDASTALACCQEIDELARLTAVSAAQLYGGDRALVLLEDARGELQPTAETGWKTPLDEDCGIDRAGLALLRDVQRMPDGEADPDGLRRLAESIGASWVEVLPLCGSSEALGALVVAGDRERGEIDHFTAYTARTLGTQAALGVERVRAAESLLDASLRDVLTSVGNRRKAMQALEVLKPGDVVALIDLDRFKQVNDCYGHAAGDRVLRTLAEFLRSSLRVPDEIFRFGGEEFLAVLHDAGEGGAPALERIRARWHSQDRVTTFSAGVAIAQEDEAHERTLARADAALYEAKRQGRDRVLPWTEDLGA